MKSTRCTRPNTDKIVGALIKALHDALSGKPVSAKISKILDIKLGTPRLQYELWQAYYQAKRAEERRALYVSYLKKIEDYDYRAMLKLKALGKRSCARIGAPTKRRKMGRKG